MKFGLRLPSFALGPKTATLAEMGAYLRRAEDLGFDSAMCIDHLLIVPPATVRTWLEPMVLLAALAGVTRTIRLGPLVLVLPLRNPVYFAKEWATFDVLAGGRSILGVGVGWHDQEFAAMNVPRHERGRRMDEMLEAINVHPRVGEGTGSSQSKREQGSEKDPEVLEELDRLNRLYEEQFGFRFVVFVNRRPRSEILKVLRQRLQRTREEELATAIDDLVSIAEDRYRRGILKQNGGRR
ncbi:MAG: LLM class flavin-dependent oxidoreductase [Armatimonadetes bacterium]|nr:LLM class flavin-dependent oxidoreductase [Armatimonadota bacterium]